MTAADMSESNEVWWIRRACQRSRNKIASMVAERFGLHISTSMDTQSHQNNR
jgi:hypothetical protein